MKRELTQQRLKHWLNYNATTGTFTWIKRPNVRIKEGSVAGTVLRGYIRISVDGTIHAAARLAHLFMTGRWPENDMDHIDGDSMNNRWSNLRDVSTSLNIQNQRKPHRGRNGTGYLGVGMSRSGKYRSRISAQGKEHGLGWHDTPEQAHEAYVKAKRQLHAGGVL